MRLITSSLVAAGTVAGIVGAVVSYQSVAVDSVAQQPVAAPAAEPTPTVTTELLPCEEGTKLVKGTCVRTKHRIVIREAPAPAAAAPARARGPERGPRTRDRDDDPSRPTTPSDDDRGSAEDEPDHDEDEPDEPEDRDDHDSDD